MRPTMLAALAALGAAVPAAAQPPNARVGEAVPRDVREVYDKGLQYLVKRQSEAGDYPGGNNGPGVTGLALMVFLASGEDPNFGLYSTQVRKAVRKLVADQDASTGYFGNSMYHHGFATLALAEAYGVVDDRHVWPDGKKPRSIGAALELAVRASLTSQKKNPLGAWRYSPDAADADTSVSGSILVSLLAARNAGIEVPDDAIDRAVSYFAKMTSDTGTVGYSGLGGFGESTARSSIACLVFALARRKDLPQYKATLSHLVDRIDQTGPTGFGWMDYQYYYQSQALFQGDPEAWGKWNKQLVRQLKSTQQADGGIPGAHGPEVGTALSVLALALNYRFLPIYER